jgi:flagellar assembly factor FliW
MTKIETRFGPLEIDPQTVLEFPQGLPGFEQCIRYKLLHEDRVDPQVMWLQSLDDADLVFSVIEAERLGLNYQIALTDEEEALLALKSPQDAVLLLILSRPEDGSAPVAANTRAPLVINPLSRKGLQKAGVRADIVFSNL